MNNREKEINKQYDLAYTFLKKKYYDMEQSGTKATVIAMLEFSAQQNKELKQVLTVLAEEKLQLELEVEIQKKKVELNYNDIVRVELELSQQNEDLQRWKDLSKAFETTANGYYRDIQRQKELVEEKEKKIQELLDGEDVLFKEIDSLKQEIEGLKKERDDLNAEYKKLLDVLEKEIGKRVDIEEAKIEFSEDQNIKLHIENEDLLSRIKELEEGLRAMYDEFEGTAGMCEPDASCIEVLNRAKNLLSTPTTEPKEGIEGKELLDGDVLIGLKNFSMTDSKHQFLTKGREYPITGFTDNMVVIKDDAESDHYFTLDPDDVSYWEKFLKLKPRP